MSKKSQNRTLIIPAGMMVLGATAFVGEAIASSYQHDEHEQHEHMPRGKAPHTFAFFTPAVATTTSATVSTTFEMTLRPIDPVMLNAVTENEHSLASIAGDHQLVAERRGMMPLPKRPR